MKKLLTLLILFFSISFGYAQQTHNFADAPKQTGTFWLDITNIEVYLPDGYVCVDGQATRDYLTNYLGTSESKAKNVVGMIVPANTTSYEDMDEVWILQYIPDVGHIVDNDGADLDFATILATYNNHSSEDQTMSWAWDPDYDSERHLLTLPLLTTESDGEYLSLRQILFGRKDLLIIDARGPDTQTLKTDNEQVINALQFAQPNRYSDYDHILDNTTYASVSNFLFDKPIKTAANADGNNIDDQEYTYDPEDFNFSDENIVIAGIKIVATIVGIMLILMLLVAITNRKKENSRTITGNAINVLLRIGVFAMVYLLIIALSIVAIWLALKLTIAIFSNVFSIKLLLVVGGGWILLGSFLFSALASLIPPLKAIKDRVEISRSDAPKLFNVIEEVSKSAGQKMPKHIYLSPTVNACVFYDKPFLSLFGRNEKNIEIGLGLLYGLNDQELKSIIAHEYGHFSQSSMRIGQITSTCYDIIANMANNERTSIVRPVLKKVFLYIQRGYLSLSRSMEYGADEMGAKIAGRTATISALCKTEVIAERFDVYSSLVSHIYQYNKYIPKSFWQGFEYFLTMSNKFDGIEFDHTTTAKAPLTNTAPRRVKVENVWISHPLLEQRIANINSLSDIDNYDLSDAHQLVPEKTYDALSNYLFSAAGWSNATVCSDEKYNELLAKNLDEQSFSFELRPFFNRNILYFELSNDSENANSEINTDVFNDKNARFVEAYAAAISDYQTMLLFKNKQIDQKQIQYDGHIYNRKDVPCDAQLEIVNNLKPRVIGIDRSIGRLALSKSDNKGLIIKAYDNIFYSQAAIQHIVDDFLPLRNDAARLCHYSSDEMSEEQFKNLKYTLINLKNNLLKLINSLEMQRLNPVMHVDMAQKIQYIYDNQMFEGESLSGNDINSVLSLPDDLLSEFKNLNYYSKKIITDTIEGKPLIMYWNNSVSATTAPN